jgi:hypothetical protein
VNFIYRKFRSLRHHSERDRGSMPIALFVTIMFLVLSISIVGILTWQIGQNRAEDQSRNANWGLGSAIGAAAEIVGPSARALSGVPTIEPTTWTALPVGNNNVFYHWWISSSANAAVNPSILPAGNWSAAAFGNNLWVGINSAGMAFTSPDGTVWTQRNALPNTPALTYTHLTYGLGKYIATSSTSATTIATSADGITWTSVTIGVSGTYLPTCSTTTCVFASNSAAAGYYSTNLSTFSVIPAFPFIANAVAFAVTTFVVVGNGTLATSTDGATWISRTVSNHNWSSVGAVNGKWAASYSTDAGNNTITTSPDATTWSDQTLVQAGNWIAMVPAGPQMALISGPISGVSQSTYLATSDGVNWVSNSLTAASAWIGAAGSFQSFLVYPNSNSGYIIPITTGVKASQTLTVSARVQAGQVTNSNNGQYLATMSFNWNASTKHWSSVRYVGSSASSLSVTPDAPTGVVATRTAPGSITVSWIAPANNGSSAVSSYTATASGGGYICPNGGQLTGTSCTVTVSSAAVYDAQHYACTGADSLSGTTCTAITTYAATNNAAYYSCTAGDSLSGTTCTTTTTYPATDNPQYYSCDSGGSLSGSTCTVSGSYAASYSAGYYYCPSGGSLSGSTCTVSSSYAASYSAGYYSCPSGGSLSGTNCIGAPYAATYHDGYQSCPNGGTYSGGICSYPATYHPTVYGCYGGATLSGTTCTNSMAYRPPTSYTAFVVTAAYYSCDSGGNLSGSTCTYGATWVPAWYTCDQGGSLSGSTCYGGSNSYPANYNAGYYYCPSGGSLSGSTCYTSSSYGASYSAGYYYCPSGGSLSGSTCLTTSTYTATNHPQYYSCTAGDSLSGSTCTTTTTYAATNNPQNYSCNAGDSLDGSTCTNTTTYAATYNVQYYSCTAGDSLDGSTCTNTTTYAATNVPAAYSCASGTLAGNACLNDTVTSAVYNSGAYQCVSSTATTCTITGMEDGTYSFSVTATNGEGVSPASVASSLVQPQLMTISYVATTFATTATQTLAPTVSGSSGATLTYAETGALPAGTTFNTATGIFTRSASGVTTGYPLSVSVSVTDSLTGFTAIGALVFGVIVP